MDIGGEFGGDITKSVEKKHMENKAAKTISRSL